MFIVDVQGFQYGTENVLYKDIVILNTDSNCYSHRFLKMPVHMTYFLNHFQTSLNHITRNIHGCTCRMMIVWNTSYYHSTLEKMIGKIYSKYHHHRLRG